jgi:hypothetical protein
MLSVPLEAERLVNVAYDKDSPLFLLKVFNRLKLARSESRARHLVDPDSVLRLV